LEASALLAKDSTALRDMLRIRCAHVVAAIARELFYVEYLRIQLRKLSQDCDGRPRQCGIGAHFGQAVGILSDMVEQQAIPLPSVVRSVKVALIKSSIAAFAASHGLADAETGCRVGAWVFLCGVFEASRCSDGPAASGASHSVSCFCFRDGEAREQLEAWLLAAAKDTQLVPLLLKGNTAWQEHMSCDSQQGCAPRS
jgi:hypothetical protein